MAQLGLAMVGQVAGGLIGGPMGAGLGGLVGALAGSLLFPEQIPDVEGPRLNDLQVQVSTEGQPIPVVYGTMCLAGNVIWALPITAIKTSEDAGGMKGMPSQSITHYSYFGNFAVGLAEGEIGGIGRIWADTKLIYDPSPSNTGAAYKYGGASLETSGATNLDAAVTGAMGGMSELRIYLGNETQEADPLIEADQGAGDTPAFRGLAYVVFENLPLADFGNRLPNITAEVASAVTPSTPFANLTGAQGLTRNHMYMDLQRNVLWGSTGWVQQWDLWTNTLRFAVQLSYAGPFGAVDHEGYYYCGSVLDELNPPYGQTAVQKLHPDTGQRLAEAGTTFATINVTYGWIEARHVRAGGKGGTAASLLESRVLVCSEVSVGGWNLFAFQTERDEAGTDSLWLEARAGLGWSWTYAVVQDRDGYLWATGASFLVPTTAHLVKLRVIPGGTAGNPSSIVIEKSWLDYVTPGSGLAYDALTHRLIVGSTPQGVMCFDIETETEVWTNTATSFGYGMTMHHGIVGRRLWQNHGGTLGYIDVDTGDYVTTGPDMQALLVIVTTGALYNPHSESVITMRFIGDPAHIYLNRYDFVTGATLDTVVSDLCDRAGLTGNQYDVTALTGDTVRGYALTRRSSVRSFLEPLRGAYFFDGVENDGSLGWVKRGGASAATLTAADLVTVGQNGQASGVISRRLQDVDLPAQLDVQFIDVNRDYQQGAQSAKRIMV